MPNMKNDDLEKMYRESESADRDIFSEQRSNILLVSGEHYRRIRDGIDRNLRGSGQSKTKRLRLVKNHTQKITSDIKDLITSLAPGVTPVPKNETELQDQKAADLSRSVWLDGKDRIEWDDLVDRFINCFVDVGEVCSKVFFDPTAGQLRGYQQATAPDGQLLFEDPNGQPTVMQGIPGTPENPGQPGIPDAQDPVTGQIIPGSPEVPPQEEIPPVAFKPIADKEKPLFKGSVVIEKIDPYNLLRAKNATSIKDSPYVIVRKMMDIDKVKELVKGSENAEEKLEWIKESSETTYKIFDSTKGSFQDSEGQVLLKEYFFRQCQKYPMGYFYITVDEGILFEGPLPFGENGEIAFPVKYGGYDLIEASARHASPIRPLRPYQAEVNRTASSISETQITLGPDKLILKGGAKVSKGVDLPGMRTIHVSGPDPIILSGRSGDQYVRHLESQISEMYRIGKVSEGLGDGPQAFDPRIDLFKSLRQKNRFIRQAGRFERFLKHNCETFLFLSQKYLGDDEIIRAAGKSEKINIPEFRDVDRLDYSIQIEPISDDIDTMMGRASELEMIAQYLGKDMPDDVRGKLMKNLPFLSKESIFDELTIDDDNVESDILAMDRGEERAPQRYDNHELYVRRLTHRMKQGDFQYLQENIKSLYVKKKEAHEQFLADIQKEIMESEKGFIPTGGGLAKADIYTQVDPSDPSKTKRALFPVEALEWLKKRLEEQGSNQQQMAGMNLANQAEIGSMAQAQVQQGPPAPDQQAQDQLAQEQFLNQNQGGPIG